MSKTKEELNALKERIENVSKELRELTPEELEQVTGGGRAIVSHSPFLTGLTTSLGGPA